MSTGDIKNNLRKLQVELKLVKIDKDVDMENLSKGLTAAFLPIYHYVFLNYSRPLAELISNINIDMYGKSDLKFLESMYKVLRELFSYKPPITKEQFFSSGFIERKIIMCTEVLNMVREKHKSMMPKPAVRYAPKNRTNSPTQPPVRVSSARPAATSDSPLSIKERSGKQDTRHSEEVKLQVDSHRMANPVIHMTKQLEKRPTSATIVSSNDIDTDTVPRVINELLHTHTSPPGGSKKRPTSAAVVSSRVIDDIDTDTVPRVINELLHKPPSGSQINPQSVDNGVFAQSGTWAHARYMTCPIATDQRREPTRMHAAVKSYNPSSYGEMSTGGGCGNYAAALDDVERSAHARPWRTVDHSAASDMRNGEACDRHVTIRGGCEGDIEPGYIREGDPVHCRMSMASMAVNEVTTAGDRHVTIRGGCEGDIEPGYIREGDPVHCRMSMASMAYHAPCEAALEGSHSDKVLTPDAETTPLRTITFPAATSPTVQETLTSIMQSQRDMNSRIVSLEKNLAPKTDHGLDRPPEDRALGSAQLENVLARLTLLENRMADLDVKKGANTELHHSVKSTADETFDSIRGSSKLRCSNGVMDMNSPGKDDLAEGDYTHMSDAAFTGDPTHRINELLKQTEEMLEKSQATAAFS